MNKFLCLSPPYSYSYTFYSHQSYLISLLPFLSIRLLYFSILSYLSILITLPRNLNFASLLPFFHGNIRKITETPKKIHSTLMLIPLILPIVTKENTGYHLVEFSKINDPTNLLFGQIIGFYVDLFDW